MKLRVSATVALLTEGVGRNVKECSLKMGVYVALLTEGVGRNYEAPAASMAMESRPPRGGRG